MMRATLTIRARSARISGSTAFAGAVLAQLPDVEVVTNPQSVRLIQFGDPGSDVSTVFPSALSRWQSPSRLRWSR